MGYLYLLLLVDLPGPKEPWMGRGAYWHHLTNTIYYSVRGGSDAACRCHYCSNLLVILTVGKSADGIAGVTESCKVATRYTGQVEPSFRQRCGISGGHNDSIAVSPRVTWLRITIRCTGQYVALRELFAGFIHRH